MSDVKAGPLRSMFVGAVLAVDAVGHCLALATFCFAGALAAGVGLATGTMLLSSVVATLALFAFSRFKGVLGIAQDTSIALLAPAIAVAGNAATGGDGAQVATGLAVMGLSALLSGAGFWIVGRLGLGRLVRLFPYPVAAGFLAGSGAMLVTAGLFIVTGTDGWSSLVRAVLDPGIDLGLLAAVALALALCLVQARLGGSTGLLVVLALFLGGFYASLALSGTDIAQARLLGLLPQPGPAQGSLAPDLALLALIDWQAVALVAPSLAAVTVLSLIGVLLNTSGVELATGAEVDANRELRVTGAANVLIGAFGGLTSFLQAGASIVVHKLQVSPRPMVLGHVGVALVACLYAERIVQAVPTFVAAGLLMFIGLSMLADWLLATRRQLMPADWLLVLGIVALTLGFGILTAVLVGLGLAVGLFAVGYARLPVIRRTTDAARRPSVVDRSAEDSATLAAEGHRIVVFHLQGTLFFGSVDQMAADITRRLDQGLRDLILDAAGVDQIDAAACAGLEKLALSLGRRGLRVHLAQLRPESRAILDRWGLGLTTDRRAPPTVLRDWPTLDAALDACEEMLLDDLRGPDRHHGLPRMLADLGANHPRLPELIARLTPRDLAPGEVLIAAGSSAGDVYVLESGRLAVLLPGPQGPELCVRIMAPGAVVGEIAQLLDLPRSADVRAQTPARVWRMAPGALQHDAELGQLWMAILARALAHKLIQTNRLVTAVLPG